MLLQPMRYLNHYTWIWIPPRRNLSTYLSNWKDGSGQGHVRPSWLQATGFYQKGKFKSNLKGIESVR